MLLEVPSSRNYRASTDLDLLIADALARPYESRSVPHQVRAARRSIRRAKAKTRRQQRAARCLNKTGGEQTASGLGEEGPSQHTLPESVLTANWDAFERSAKLRNRCQAEELSYNIPTQHNQCDANGMSSNRFEHKPSVATWNVHCCQPNSVLAHDECIVEHERSVGAGLEHSSPLPECMERCEQDDGEFCCSSAVRHWNCQATAHQSNIKTVVLLMQEKGLCAQNQGIDQEVPDESARATQVASVSQHDYPFASDGRPGTAGWT